MSYIIRNCPCYTSKGGYYDCWANQHTWCENITDCVIKQVIEKCKYCYNAEQKSRYKTNGYMLADTILQLFDIEEVNK